MDKLKDIKELLVTIGMPKAQQSDLCALTVLAMADLTNSDKYTDATNDWIRIHEVIVFIRSNYGVNYAENTRETIRKQAMHHFRAAALIEDNGVATNSPKYGYRLTDEFLSVIHQMDESQMDLTRNKALKSFLNHHEKLVDVYTSKKRIRKMPVRINGSDYSFSPGSHNKLQKAILEELAPRFAPGSSCLYVGDTTHRDMVKDESTLRKLGLIITIHDKMPDVVLYREDKDWLYFIEAVDSVGPMSPERVRDITQMSSEVKSGIIFVTAFLTFSKFKQFSEQLAWETEVWIADLPDHMIHLNGDKFMGPR
ncbi:BsuBI/PstI family type II restriction endonuclease [uncultured Porphyromonas sp.]|uniref:BsuBI/PstI family type II restriction endonuclease n=1 Tax=uncultured Porphyromonas sp. TaxID=159274 RepID=UPI002598D6BC|nr:BsuBI/PstI family type II restriction endonuclease [uncultured Porphyromonas sp.]